VKARVVSGMRPTGQLHLGHLVGALSNWVPLQDQYDCFYFVADWHALTSEYAASTTSSARAAATAPPTRSSSRSRCSPRCRACRGSTATRR
jgi:tryptophanyl-tRNA synthetase